MSEQAGFRYFFHSPAFLKNQGLYHTAESRRGDFSVKIFWFKQQREGFSPLRAPFGGLDYTGTWSLDAASDLIVRLMAELKEEKIQTFVMTQSPDAYQPEENLSFARLLLETGFELQHQDINFHLLVNQSFRKHLHRSERWKLNKLIRHGFVFQKEEAISWEMVYPFFLESRIRKGYELSMSRESLERVFAMFPEQYSLFSVLKDGEPAAMAITVEVNSDILYVFYTADDLKFRKFSPVVLLHAGIYDYAAARKIRLLDLGTCSLRGMVNSGVATFKRSLGGIASLKNTWIWRLGASRKSS